jgi:4-carboxymuconolactone decarboxylase
MASKWRASVASSSLSKTSPHDDALSRALFHLTDFKEKAMTSKQSEPSAPDKTISDFAPKLFELTHNVLFGDIWERPGLSKRDRSLITVAALIALNRTEQLPGHLTRALDNGVTKDELIEVITHLAFYSGWPTAMSAVRLAKSVFEEKQA